MKKFILTILIAVTLSMAVKSEEVKGTKEDWSIYGVLAANYFKIRDLVRDAYIEIQTWKAIQATYEAQKNWFKRNKKRWDRISSTAQGLSANPADIFQNLKDIESMTDEIDEFIVVETREMDKILISYEDNASQMVDIGAKYIGAGAVNSDGIWNSVQNLARDNTLRSHPDWTDGKIENFEAEMYKPFFKFPAWERKNVLGKSYAVLQAHLNSVKIKRGYRDQFWARFETTIIPMVYSKTSTPKPDLVMGADVLRRVNLLNDRTDLINTELQSLQALMTIVGEGSYELSTAISHDMKIVQGVANITEQFNKINPITR
jgi:hypothetical protein